MPELSCLESRLISELQGAPGSRDHQASPSSLFGYQNTTNSQMAEGPKNIPTASFMFPQWQHVSISATCFHFGNMFPFRQHVSILATCFHFGNMFPFTHTVIYIMTWKEILIANTYTFKNSSISSISSSVISKFLSGIFYIVIISCLLSRLSL